MTRHYAAAVALCVLGLTGCEGKRARVARPVDPEASPVKITTAPSEEKPGRRLAVFPELASLAVDDFGLQLVAQERLKADGPARDVTGTTRWTVEPEGVVTVDGGYLRPVAPGKARVIARSDEGTAVAIVQVPSATGKRSWDVAEDVVPLLTRSGCNTGGCHGRADGQNGFHLSLFGYDPAGDFAGVTRNDGGRRFSTVAPEQSLFLLKATGAVPHVGGPRLTVGSSEYDAIAAWIRDGAPRTAGKTRGALTGLRIEPTEVALDEPGPRQFRVFAKYADGSERDVTRQAIYKVNDDSAATVDQHGKATLLRRAETDLIVRYGPQVVATRLSTVINPGLAYNFAERKRANFIDDLLFRRLEALQVPPSPPASDAAFLRRVTLDLTGQQPRPEQVREFLADKSPDKRAKLVDSLFKERDFVRFWQIKLGDMLEITSARPELGQTSGIYQAWLAARLKENTPWDKLVRTLLTSLGDPGRMEDGGANYALEGLDPRVAAEKTAQRFLGLRLRCAQCHDHPFDVWTQDDYFGLAAAFAKVGREGTASYSMGGRPKVVVNPEGKVEHLRTKKTAEPRLLTHEAINVAKAEDPRKALATWMTGPENPYFARAFANWTWAQFFGKGIADPPDDLSRSNPPVHPELLDALAKHFVTHGYDVRDLIKTIVLSEAYGTSSEPVKGNESDIRLFSHQLPRPLTAHQMADALAQATDVPNRFKDKPAGTRAVEVADPSVQSAILDTFGRCSRQGGCAGVQTPELSLRQSLLLIGGDVIESKVSSLDGYLANLLDLKPTPEEVVENLYYRALCRPPTEQEQSHWSAELRRASVFSDAAQDLFWSLLNSREFAFNH